MVNGWGRADLRSNAARSPLAARRSLFADTNETCEDIGKVGYHAAVARDKGVPLHKLVAVLYKHEGATEDFQELLKDITTIAYQSDIAPGIYRAVVEDRCIAIANQP